MQDRLPALLRETYDRTAALIRVLLDVLIGAVFSLYLLAGAPKIRACFSERLPEGSRLRLLLHGCRSVCGTFSCFLSSQCRESLILGGLCYGGMLLFHFPYPLLISAVIAVTNIVPYLGPVAGSVPCVLLLLFVKPEAVMWFVLFLIVLQQAESNFVYPRVVGHSVGLPPAWVLASVTLGGGLFGITGMLLGVPLTAALYALLFPAREQQDPA